MVILWAALLGADGGTTSEFCVSAAHCGWVLVSGGLDGGEHRLST